MRRSPSGSADRTLPAGTEIFAGPWRDWSSAGQAWFEPLKLSRPAALVKLATEHLAALKDPAEKLWEGAVERMFPAAKPPAHK